MTWVTVVMSIAHGLRLEMSFPCGSMWLTNCAAHAIRIVRILHNILMMFSDRNLNEIFTFRSTPSPFRTRCRAVLQKPIWFFLSPAISGRLGSVPFDFSMIFPDGHFWPRRILRFPPSEPLRGFSSGDVMS